MENEDREALVKKSADEAAERSIEAIEDLVVFTLKEPKPGRFNEAKRLCEVAQSLLKARARRAADFQEEEPELITDRNHYVRAVAQALNQTNFVANPITFTTNTATTGTNYNVITTMNPINFTG